MIETIIICITMIVIACIAAAAFYQWILLRRLVFERETAINNHATELALSEAVEKRLKSFDTRINDTWSTISATKEELNALKLSIGLKGNR